MNSRTPAIALILVLLAACPKRDETATEDETVAKNPTPTTAAADHVPRESAFARELQEKLLTAQPGAVIEVPAGTFHFERTLTLRGKERITLRGAGMDKTILSFKGQKSGAEGIKVTADHFTIEDLAIEDTKGDAIKIEKSRGVTIRRVGVEWTRGPNEENGAYGLYPVQCQDVLIEDSRVSGASDAGIYVGQSKNIIVRRNRASYNVAGIEIENSTFADVYENLAQHNTGGILVFDLPDLDVQGGQNIRLYKNRILDNNTENFAPEGNIVATVPPGTGIMIMANDNIEVFENEIRGQGTTNLAIVSYLVTQRPIDREKNNNAAYDAYPEGIYVHDNQFSRGGEKPRGLLVAALSFKMKPPFPDVLYDGIVDQDKLVDGQLPPDKRICITPGQGQGQDDDFDFANIDAANDFANISQDLTPHDCTLPPLEAITIPGV